MPNKKRTLPFEIKNPGKLLTLTYVASLSIIAILSIVVHVMLDHIIAQQSETGHVVNISGQQRMLSQRTSLFTIEYLTNGSEEARQLARQSLERMQNNHEELLFAHNKALEDGVVSPLSDSLKAMYFSAPLHVDAQLNRFSEQILAALEHPVSQTAAGVFNHEMAFMAMSRQPFLSALHAVVEQYEKESVEKVNELRFAQDVVLGIIIITILVEALFIFRPMVAKISRFAMQLQYDANYDQLSGIFNRRAFNLLASKSVALSKRHNRPMAIVIVDIDLFKKINDTYGHAAGDMTIRHAAEMLLKNCRKSDVVARIGGEEFAVLLPDTDKDGAAFVAEKMRQQIQECEVRFEDQRINYTVSAGVAELENEHRGIEQALQAADEALYRSKHSGRNQVTVA